MSNERTCGVFADDFGPVPEFVGDPRLAAVRAALRVGEARRALDLASAPPPADSSGSSGSADRPADPDLAVLLGAYRNAARMADLNWFPDQLGASGVDGGPAFGEMPEQEAVAVALAPEIALERVVLDLEVNMRAARTSASISARYGNMNGMDPVGMGLQSISTIDNAAVTWGHEPTRAWCARQASALQCPGCLRFGSPGPI